MLVAGSMILKFIFTFGMSCAERLWYFLATTMVYELAIQGIWRGYDFIKEPSDHQLQARRRRRQCTTIIVMLIASYLAHTAYPFIPDAPIGDPLNPESLLPGLLGSESLIPNSLIPDLLTA